MATRKDWERRPQEGIKSYEAFSVYRDLGTSRSIEQVARSLSKSDQLIKRWSYTHDWVQRVTAYDDYIDAQARVKLERDAIRRKADMLKRHTDTGRALQSWGLTYVKDNRKPDKSSDAITAIKTGVEMERKSEGLPEWIFEVVNADDNELTRQYNELLATLGSVRSGDETEGDDPTGQDTSPDQSRPADQ